jgi:hypothetical protein
LNFNEIEKIIGIVENVIGIVENVIGIVENVGRPLYLCHLTLNIRQVH